MAVFNDEISGMKGKVKNHKCCNLSCTQGSQYAKVTKYVLKPMKIIGLCGQVKVCKNRGNFRCSNFF